MSVSRVILTLAAVAVSLAGCKAELTVKTKTRYVEQGITKEDTTDWAGERIEIRIEGVGVSVNGGVKVTADPNAKKVTATARFLAMAFSEEKPNADQSIIEAKETFTITRGGNGIIVSCGHGGTHGSSNGGESGCELAEITVPAGNATQKVELKVLGGNGDMTLQLSGASISNVGVNNNGSGSTSAALPATKGGSISIVASKSGDIAATMPADFAADEIVLQADDDKIQNAFTDAKLGAGAGGRGTPGSGLASLKLTSQEFAGSTGNVTLR